MNKKIQHIKSLIAKGRLEAAFDVLLNSRRFASIEKASIRLSAWYYSVKRDFNMGVLGYEDFDVYRNKLKASLLENLFDLRHDISLVPKKKTSYHKTFFNLITFL